MVEQATATPIEAHDVHSKRLMAHAWEQLAAGDRLQASEKAWGAIAHQLKVIAKARGLKYTTHRDVFPIMERIAAETDDPELVAALFATARGLHQNFYADTMPLKSLKGDIELTQKLLAILETPALLREPSRGEVISARGVPTHAERTAP